MLGMMLPFGRIFYRCETLSDVLFKMLRCVLPQLKATKRHGILQNEIIAVDRCGWNEPQREREVFLELQTAGANGVCKHGRQRGRWGENQISLDSCLYVIPVPGRPNA